ncbi:hypothetical protein FOCC_FOCC011074 [Frankliniella occidentalis]|nr:hypothetical protein FOCC_FOCC011074 [Frankliniella occidentalis]
MDEVAAVARSGKYGRKDVMTGVSQVGRDSNGLAKQDVRTESQGGAWCPKLQITTSPNEWLQVELHTVHVITAVETQGRFGNGQGQEYAEAYMLEYYRPRLDKWVRYRDENGQEVSLGWVGWKNESRDGQPIEIKFEFDKVREFKAVHIFCNNQFMKDVQHLPVGEIISSLSVDLPFMSSFAVLKGNENTYLEAKRDLSPPIRASRIRFLPYSFHRRTVFSEAQVFFSVGGRHFNGQPITYTTMEDRIFESSRNVSIKLHHRVGRFVKLRLHFAAKWMLISEISFDSSVAHGNFTPEPAETGDSTDQQRDVYVEKDAKDRPHTKTPVASAEDEDSTYMAVIMGVLIAVILLLAAVIFVIVSRHRKRKCFASPLNSKSALPTSHAALSASEKAVGAGAGGSSTGCGTLSGAYGVREVGAGGLVDGYGHVHGAPPPPGGLGGDMDHLLEGKLDDYQEPYQALKYAPYYSYSTVVMELGDQLTSKSASTPSGEYAPRAAAAAAPPGRPGLTPGLLCLPADTTYDYAVPESGGGIPLLSPEAALPLPSSRASDKGSLFSKSSSCNGSRSDDAKSRTKA